MADRPRVAIAQDWLAAEAGSEHVTAVLSRLLPSAEIYTSFFDPGIYDGAISPERVHTWALQRVPSLARRFRSLLPLYPLYFSWLNLERYELVVSSSVAFTHAVRTAPGALHIAYVYTPLRYAWDLDAYLAGSSASPAARMGARLLRPPLRRWDRAAARRPDVLVAISDTVRARIQQHWGRDAEVIYPPVPVDEIEMSARDDGFLLTAARMLAYRRLDLAVDAATRLGRQLIVVGDGPERARLEARAGPSVQFLGRVDRPRLLDLFARSHAYLVPGIEDFGIAPVEAMAFGKPVVGFRGGGVAETVVDGETGVLFDRQDVDSIVEAIERLDDLPVDPVRNRARAERYSTDAFHRKFIDLFERFGVDPALYAASGAIGDDRRT